MCDEKWVETTYEDRHPDVQTIFRELFEEAWAEMIEQRRIEIVTWGDAE